MSAPDYMQFEVAAYLADTLHLRRCQHGSYIKLICWYWRAQGPLPDDDDQLAQIAGCNSKREWLADRKILARFFTIEDGVWRHKRIDAEIERCRDRMAKAKANGDKATATHKRNAETRKSLKNIDQGEPAGSDPVTGRLSNQNQNQKVEEKENTNLPHHQNPTAPREDGAEAPGRGKLVVVDFSKVGKLVDTAKRLGVSPIDIAEAVQGSEKPGIKHPAAYLARVLADRYAHKLHWDTIDEFDLPTIRSAIAGDEAVIARIADAYTRRRMVMGSARR